MVGEQIQRNRLGRQICTDIKDLMSCGILVANSINKLSSHTVTTDLSHTCPPTPVKANAAPVCAPRSFFCMRRSRSRRTTPSSLAKLGGLLGLSQVAERGLSFTPNSDGDDPYAG